MGFDWIAAVMATPTKQIILEATSTEGSLVSFVYDDREFALDLSKSISSHPYKAFVTDADLQNCIEEGTLKVESSHSRSIPKRKLYITAIS